MIMKLTLLQEALKTEISLRFVTLTDIFWGMDLLTLAPKSPSGFFPENRTRLSTAVLL